MTFLSFVFFSCDDEIGGGDDPKLNITAYTFPKEGGSIEVYSEKGYKIYVDINDDVISDTLYYHSGKIRGFDGGWFVAAFPSGNIYKNLTIEVDANDTGEEREIPISISAIEYRCSTKYVQEK